ncbi:hypothetical protein KY310_04540, partial [Candidatus Woesearchaeota archaeon]|nr:hypothetical protein [Candidatus Woesearchaeota archaeon]
LEWILKEFKETIAFQKADRNPKVYLQSVFGDAFDYGSHGEFLITKPVQITKGKLLLPAGKYVFVDDAVLTIFADQLVIREGVNFAFGDNAKLNLNARLLSAKGTEKDKISFTALEPGLSCKIKIAHDAFLLNMYANQHFQENLPHRIMLEHCVFEGLKGIGLTNSPFNFRSVHAHLSDVEIRNCSGSDCGGLKVSQSIMELIRCYFSNNKSKLSGGAGVYTTDTMLNINDSEFIGNECEYGTFAGGIEFYYRNRPDLPGITIHDEHYQCIIKNTIFRKNLAGTKLGAASGGAVHVMSGAVLLDDDCCVEGNSKPQLSTSGSDKTRVAIMTYSPEIVKDGNE